MAGIESGSEAEGAHQWAELTYANAKKWQATFDELTITDTSEINALRKQTVGELDAIFPFTGCRVYMSGNGLRPIQDPETHEPIGEEWEYIAGVEGVHNGFDVIGDNKDDENTIHYKVVQQVLVRGLGNKLLRTVYQQLSFFNYFDLDSHCVVVSELNDIFYRKDDEADFPSQIRTVEEASDTLVHLLRSTAFRRMTRARQSQEVASLIEATEHAANLRGTELLAEAEYGYLNELNAYLMSVDIRHSVIGGTCLGLETLESLTLRKQAIRKNAHLIDKYAGICLVLHPNDETREGLHMSAEQALYVPFGQDLELARV